LGLNLRSGAHKEGGVGASLTLIYPKSNVVSAKVRVFMDFLIDHFGRQSMAGKTS